MAQTNTKTVRRKRKVRLLTRNGQYYDYNLLACVVLLTCFGLIMLYSTSAYDAQVEYGSVHIFFSGRHYSALVDWQRFLFFP